MNARAAEDISTNKTVGHFINGRDIDDSGRTQSVTNPATGAVTKQVAMASRTTVEDAIAAATDAFPAWRNTPPAKRAKVMFKFKPMGQSKFRFKRNPKCKSNSNISRVQITFKFTVGFKCKFDVKFQSNCNPSRVRVRCPTNPKFEFKFKSSSSQSQVKVQIRYKLQVQVKCEPMQVPTNFKSIPIQR